MAHMDIETAQQMMAAATKAMLECGLYQAVRTVTTNTRIGGQNEDVTCVIFSRTPAALDAIATRVEETSLDERVIEERVADGLARSVIARAAKR